MSRPGRLALLVLLLPGAAACAAGPGAPPPPTLGRGVVLISLDTVSAQHLSLYGYGRDTTPFLRSLASRGTVFDHAFVQLPGTLPSHMSIFTGLYPEQHDVFPPDAVLAPDIRTLPEVFRAGGFRTIGHTEGGYVSGRFGFARGFDEWNDVRDILWRHRDHVFARGLRSLAALQPGERFFVFLHTYAAHDPYTPPPECKGLFWSGDPPPGAKLSASAVLTEHNSGLAPLDPAVVDYYRAMYDAEIRCLDAELEKFFAALAELGLAEGVTIVVTADHGEEFLEHGGMAHEQTYHESLHVPLLVVAPGAPPGHRVRQVVQSVDIAPTLYALAGLTPPPGLPGRSLVPLLTGEDGTGGEAYSRSISGVRSLYALGPDGLLHLVSPKAATPAAAVDVASALRRWVPPGALRLEAQSYLEPASLAVEVDGAAVLSVELRPDAWSPVEVPVPDDGRSHLLRLSSPTCVTVPASLEHDRRRCVSFRVSGLPTPRSELYRADVDHLEATDRGLDLAGQRTALERRLEAHRYEPVSTAGEQPLEPEVEDQLRALGYLQ